MYTYNFNGNSLTQALFRSGVPASNSLFPKHSHEKVPGGFSGNTDVKNGTSTAADEQKNPEDKKGNGYDL